MDVLSGVYVHNHLDDIAYVSLMFPSQFPHSGIVYLIITLTLRLVKVFNKNGEVPIFLYIPISLRNLHLPVSFHGNG
jgi:hypothetical protein